jgi:hypothetical protein
MTYVIRIWDGFGHRYATSSKTASVHIDEAFQCPNDIMADYFAREFAREHGVRAEVITVGGAA